MKLSNGWKAGISISKDGELGQVESYYRRVLSVEAMHPGGLYLLGTLLTLPSVQFVGLQYTECIDELAEVHNKLGVTTHHWQEAVDDYVVSIQTALVHLSGALGRYTDVLVPFTPEWRYLASGEDMPWYPSVKLHRQVRQGDWSPVFEQVECELQRSC